MHKEIGAIELYFICKTIFMFSVSCEVSEPIADSYIVHNQSLKH